MKEFFSNEYDPYIIFYTQNTPYFFDGKLSNAKLVAFYEEIDEKYSKKTTAPPFKLNYYKSKIKGNKELISRITDYCQNLKTNYRLRGFPRTSTKAISFRLNSQDDLDLLKQEIELLNHMKSLGIVYAPEIEFLSYTKNNFSPVQEEKTKIVQHTISRGVFFYPARGRQLHYPPWRMIAEGPEKIRA